MYVSGDVNVQNVWNKNLGPAFTKAFPGFSVKVLVEGNSASTGNEPTASGRWLWPVRPSSSPRRSSECR